MSVSGSQIAFSFYIDLHIVVDGRLTVRQGHRLSHQVEDEILKAIPRVAEVLVHVEPENELTIKPDLLFRECNGKG